MGIGVVAPQFRAEPITRKLMHLRWGDRLEAVGPSGVANPLSAGELAGIESCPAHQI